MAAVAKDERLAALADKHNVAQFASFTPGAEPRPRHSRIRGLSKDRGVPDVDTAAEELLRRGAGQVNVRSFLPDRDKGNPFHYGLQRVADVASTVRALAADGYSTIVNETIDIHDGGISGVALNDVIEFVPDDTPRGVEGGEAVSVPLALGLAMLETVYGFPIRLPEAAGQRIEFSLHPLRVGYRRQHALVWELETVERMKVRPTLVWPNRFSRFIGDKAYGLLMADLIGLPVPRTTVIGRVTAPFTFGRRTGTSEVWTRPCPREQEPGRYPTTRGWTDPYQLFKLGKPPGTAIQSVLAQAGVAAAYSGATLPSASGHGDWVEGVGGIGDAFMQGSAAPTELPSPIKRDAQALAAQARKVLGPVRMEFAHDGRRAWVLQLHLSTDRYHGTVVYRGKPKGWLCFDPSDGLDRLRALIAEAIAQGLGVRVTGPVGVTSHVGDLLRRAKVPSFIGTGPA